MARERGSRRLGTTPAVSSMSPHRALGTALLVVNVALGCASAPEPREVEVVRPAVVAGAGETYFEVAGSGPAIVLVHGGFGDRRMWDDHFEALAKDYRVVRYDLRGFGRTPASRAVYSPVDDLRRLLDELGIERATLVGNSMGGGVALDFTLVHPERVEGLVLVASALNGFPATEADRARFAGDRAAIGAAFQEAGQRGPERGIDLWLQSPMVVVTSRALATRAHLRRMITENTGMFTLQHWPIEPLDLPANERLGEVRVPTLVIAGQRDTPLMRATSARAAAGIPGAKLVVIAGADHLPQMVRPVEFRDALDGLLERVERNH